MFIDISRHYINKTISHINTKGDSYFIMKKVQIIVVQLDKN